MILFQYHEWISFLWHARLVVQSGWCEVQKLSYFRV